MTTYWMVGDVANYVHRSKASVKKYEQGQGVHTPPPAVGTTTVGARLYDPEEIAAWWSRELAHRAGGVPFDALHA